MFRRLPRAHRPVNGRRGEALLRHRYLIHGLEQSRLATRWRREARHERHRPLRIGRSTEADSRFSGLLRSIADDEHAHRAPWATPREKLPINSRREFDALPAERDHVRPNCSASPITRRSGPCRRPRHRRRPTRDDTRRALRAVRSALRSSGASRMERMNPYRASRHDRTNRLRSGHGQRTIARDGEPRRIEPSVATDTRTSRAVCLLHAQLHRSRPARTKPRPSS